MDLINLSYFLLSLSPSFACPAGARPASSRIDAHALYVCIGALLLPPLPSLLPSPPFLSSLPCMCVSSRMATTVENQCPFPSTCIDPSTCCPGGGGRPDGKGGIGCLVFVHWKSKPSPPILLLSPTLHPTPFLFPFPPSFSSSCLPCVRPGVGWFWPGQTESSSI